MTGTSLKSPMSGTVMSIVAVLGEAGAAAALAGAAGRPGGRRRRPWRAAAAPRARQPQSMRAISVPIDTLSPTFATTSATVPAIGDGTSIVALSDSSVTSDCSALTTSPGFTRISMIGTSLKSPMSGTFTSIFATGALLKRQRLNGTANAQLRAGFGRSGSMPYFSIASATRLDGSNCSSASAFRLATAT